MITLHLTYGKTKLSITAPTKEEALKAFKADFPGKKPKIVNHERST